MNKLNFVAVMITALIPVMSTQTSNSHTTPDCAHNSWSDNALWGARSTGKLLAIGIPAWAIGAGTLYVTGMFSIKAWERMNRKAKALAISLGLVGLTSAAIGATAGITAAGTATYTAYQLGRPVARPIARIVTDSSKPVIEWIFA